VYSAWLIFDIIKAACAISELLLYPKVDITVIQKLSFRRIECPVSSADSVFIGLPSILLIPSARYIII